MAQSALADLGWFNQYENTFHVFFFSLPYTALLANTLDAITTDQSIRDGDSVISADIFSTGMRTGMDNTTGSNRYLTSWDSIDDPGPSKRNSMNQETSLNAERADLELPLFDLVTVAMATNKFSTEDTVGDGGFGLVYKGVLKDGEGIAVKKLSRNSRQGLHEFKNEVLYVPKLQHHNLVKPLGCGIQEVLLIYEFLPNAFLLGSLKTRWKFCISSEILFLDDYAN
ncbi:hypothetical protein NL676_036713 [Syzygium grande]|nr:hypothetical protein NL676_036713 [Syzygium grande]